MKKNIISFVSILLIVGCESNSNKLEWEKYDETFEIIESKKNDNKRLQFKYIQAVDGNKNKWFEPISSELSEFDEFNYNKLKPLIFEKSIPEIQQSIISEKLTYELLVKFYLHRIKKIEFNRNSFLNSIISLNPNIIEEAKKSDKIKPSSVYSIHGIPILLKDNINFSNLPTTAGASIFKDNYTGNSKVVNKLKENGALILGKTNLSEWAYYFCSGCPLGYSAIGGQTLNPYGRKKFESGGSSSGSGAAIAANLASVSLGTETSGSILSPSSLNSLVGLKPTVGLISRSGIIPISSSFDTAGPMTKNVIDNIIVFKNSMGYDKEDPMSKSEIDMDLNKIFNAKIKGKRFAVFKNLMDQELYKESIKKIIKHEGIIVELEPEKVDFSGFGKILDYDMKKDLNNYIKKHVNDELKIESVDDIVKFNSDDSLIRSPYGMTRFLGMAKNKILENDHIELKKKLKKNAEKFFLNILKDNQVDAVLSINNYHASYAAAANYPCLTIPMGYKNSGEPQNLTFISTSFNENLLYEVGYAFEKITKKRIPPKL